MFNKTHLSSSPELSNTKNSQVLLSSAPLTKLHVIGLNLCCHDAGVSSVAIEGMEQDQVVVIGDRVDSACLVKRLRKKVGYADLVIVEEVKPKEEKEEEKKEEKKEEKEEEKPTCQPQCHGYPYFVYYQTVDEPNPSICLIM